MTDTFDVSDQLARFIEVSKKLKELEVEKKELSEEIQGYMQIENRSKIEMFGANVTLVTTRKIDLKKEYKEDQATLAKRLPQYALQVVDQERMKLDPTCHEYFETKESSYLKVTATR